MPIPSTMADLSTSSSLNSPSGSDNIASGDDYLRAIQAILKAQVSTGGAITAASTITPDASGQYYVVSGATGISAIASTNSWNGRIIVLEFASTPIITHNGTSLILPGAANITASAGDVAGFVQESSGNWRCISYMRADGSFIANTGYAKLATAQTWTATQTPDNGTASVSASGNYSFDGTDQIRTITMTNVITVTFTAPTGITQNAMYQFILTAGDTSARTYAWNAAYKFPSAVPPISSGTIISGASDILTFIGGAANTLIYVGSAADVR